MERVHVKSDKGGKKFTPVFIVVRKMFLIKTTKKLNEIIPL